MLRHTHIALLALFALASTTLQAQEPVYGLLPPESELTGDVMPAADSPITESPAAIGQTVFTQFSAETGYGPPGQYVGPADVGTGGCASCGTGGYGAGGYGDLGCSSCGGGKCFDGCGGCCLPWRVRSKMVVMSRETNDDILVFQDLNSPAFRPLLGAGLFDLGWEAGFDLSLTQKYLYDSEIELRFFHLNEFEDTIRATGNAVELNSQFLANNQLPTVTLNPRTNPVTAIADYDTRLSTAELVYHEPFCPWWIVSAGFRYVSLEESLELLTVDSAAPALRSETNYLTDNDLYGFQLGSELILASNSDGWEVRGTARLGIYYNDLKSTVTSAGDGFVNGRGYRRTGQTGFLGEYGINAIYHMNCNTSFTFGYQLMHLTGVGLATGQPAAVLDPLDGPVLTVGHNEGTAFYHGANFGIELRW